MDFDVMSNCLFDNVKYHIAGRVPDAVVELLTKFGGHKSYYLGPFTTHLVVGEDADEYTISEAQDMLDIPAVDQKWIEASISCGSLLPPAAFSVVTRLFSKVILFIPNCDCLSKSDKEKLWAMVSWYGGKILPSLDARVTHVVTACNFESEKPVVTPKWLIESIKKNRLQDECVNDFQNFGTCQRNLTVGANSEKIKLTKVADFKGENNEYSKHSETSENLNKVTPQILSKPDVNLNPVDITTFGSMQNELIKKFLATMDAEFQMKFYRLSTGEQRKFLAEKNLILNLNNGEIMLTDYQKNILESAATNREENVSSSFLHEKSELKLGTKNFESQEAHLSSNIISNVVATNDKQIVEEEEPQHETSTAIDDSENSHLKKLNSTPKSLKRGPVLTEMDHRAMNRMSRPQRHLYLQQLEKGLVCRESPMSSKILSRVDKSNSPGSPLSSSSINRDKQKCSLNSPTSTKREGITSNSPRSGRSLPKKICLLGCTFLITGYQETKESVHVRKWKHVIVKHGGKVVDELTDMVTHVITPNMCNEISRLASNKGVRMVTSHWLNDCITTLKMTPPHKGVHFPHPEKSKTDISKMKLTITGFEGLDREYIKDMIKMTGASYSAYFDRENAALICRDNKGEKYKKSFDWKVPAVSIDWLNDVVFSNVDVADKLHDPVYQKFNGTRDALLINSDLVSDYLKAWRDPIVVTKEVYYEYKRTCQLAEKRSSEASDPSKCTPEKKRLKLDPRALFMNIGL